MKKRWLARLSLVLMLAAAAVLVGFAGLRSLALVGIGLLGVCVVVAAGYWFLANRGVLRWLAFALVVLVPIAILVLDVLHQLLWVAVLSIALALLGVATARVSLSTGGENTAMPGLPGVPAATRVHRDEPPVGWREGGEVRAEGEGPGAGSACGHARRS